MMPELSAYGIYKVPGTRFSNSYLVETEEKSILIIDAGTKSDASKILSFIKDLGKENSVSYIILTHSDMDHSGGAVELRKQTGAKIAIHELDAPRVAGEKALKQVSGLGRVLIPVFSIFVAFDKFKPDITLKHDEKLGPLTVIHTPGHTEGSICLYKPGAALFSGDTIITNKSGIIRLPAGYLNSDPRRLKESVKRLSELEFSILLPGHGVPLLSNASRKVKEFAQAL